MPAVQQTIDQVRRIDVDQYKYGFETTIESVKAPKGLDEETVRFSIRDEGLGIAPEDQPRIFEKFHRLDPEMRRGVGGTGLGLYICRELVERMDGRISVESRVGEGSTFTFELPTVE